MELSRRFSLPFLLLKMHLDMVFQKKHLRNIIIQNAGKCFLLTTALGNFFLKSTNLQHRTHFSLSFSSQLRVLSRKNLRQKSDFSAKHYGIFSQGKPLTRKSSGKGWTRDFSLHLSGSF